MKVWLSETEISSMLRTTTGKQFAGGRGALSLRSICYAAYKIWDCF